ncbi:putative holliday junction resolvase [Papillibacter cinnamivorans DSM 12816]|uniref:Putative pre-16S rRNA nuclease n=2 Tax=Papillibacter TaxID=100175 RepID=A0A1W1Z2P0_9FIRM|nr:Holliday junction resolvase RuvX [Papillibacter cinnamivorans]SMC42351.1 putative holliday junction resolvase [Papillibacter cinnamivorans DSM 12816]
MRVMAIDYGDARTGIAVSDPAGILTGTAETIHERNAGRVVDRICRLAEEMKVGELVVGYPKNMNATLGPRAAKSEELAELLREKSGLKVILWDERRTTTDAHRILTETGRRGQKRKDRVDAVAASLILEGYLRSKHLAGEED